jgi:uncharacterized phiE125 gp8 family phage protein
MSLSSVLITAPTETPISMDDAWSYLRVSPGDEDALIEMFIATATARLDGKAGILGRALVTQTWRQDYDSFSGEMRLPLGPLASISSVKHYDEDNTLQTVASSVYTTRTDETGSYVILAPNQFWPAVYSRDDAVQITFVAGQAVSSVPSPIKAAILLMVGDLYAFRETAQVGSVSGVIPMSTTVDALLAPYRAINL